MEISSKRKVILEERKAVVEERLALYRAQEKKMLEDAPQVYTIGSRSVQRYQLGLNQIADMIKTLEEELQGIENELSGSARRKAISAIPTDW